MGFRTFAQNFGTATLPSLCFGRSGTWSRLWLAAIVKLRGEQPGDTADPCQLCRENRTGSWQHYWALGSTIPEHHCPVTQAHKSPSLTEEFGLGFFILFCFVFVVSNTQGLKRNNKVHICICNMLQSHLESYKNKHIHTHLQTIYWYQKNRMKHK